MPLLTLFFHGLPGIILPLSPAALRLKQLAKNGAKKFVRYSMHFASRDAGDRGRIIPGGP